MFYLRIIFAKAALPLFVKWYFVFILEIISSERTEKKYICWTRGRKWNYNLIDYRIERMVLLEIKNCNNTNSKKCSFISEKFLFHLNILRNEIVPKNLTEGDPRIY